MLISPLAKIEHVGEFASVLPPIQGNLITRTLAVRADGSSSLISVNADRCHIDSLSTRRDWNPLVINPQHASVVYEGTSSSGTFLILVAAHRRPRRARLSFNTFFRDVAVPQRRVMTHRFEDGSERHGVLQLPINHRPGDRHPVIVWAYPRSMPSIDDAFGNANSSINVIYPVQYLLARGFAFFQAPFPIGGSSSQHPMRAAIDAVVPWLDVLARQSDIIPEQYGFFGHSNAGYVALAMECLSRRFKAIVAWDTFPEIGYDTLHTYGGDVALNCAGNLLQADRMFYEDPTQPYAAQPTPPWKRPVEYIVNDPLFNLNRASTPMLLVEGELDIDSREMEEVYSILYGRGVPVELAYYWGEGHVFASPGNILDSWQRTEKFFRRYLMPTETRE